MGLGGASRAHDERRAGPPLLAHAACPLKLVCARATPYTYPALTGPYHTNINSVPYRSQRDSVRSMHRHARRALAARLSPVPTGAAVAPQWRGGIGPGRRASCAAAGDTAWWLRRQRGSETGRGRERAPLQQEGRDAQWPRGRDGSGRGCQHARWPRERFCSGAAAAALAPALVRPAAQTQLLRW